MTAEDGGTWRGRSMESVAGTKRSIPWWPWLQWGGWWVSPPWVWLLISTKGIRPGTTRVAFCTTVALYNQNIACMIFFNFYYYYFYTPLSTSKCVLISGTFKAVVRKSCNKLSSDKLANILYSSVTYLICRTGCAFYCVQSQVHVTG